MSTGTAKSIPLSPTLDEEECEWCGQPIKWPRLLPQKVPIPIDPDPLDTYDPKGKLGRVHPSKAEGYIYAVKYLAEDERWMYARTYVPHKDTCPEAHEWASHA